MPKLYHGGVGGLWAGDVLVPGMSHARHVDGCAQCEAQASGKFVRGFDPPTPPAWVYATTDRDYARYYASRAVRGNLYEVELEGDVEESVEDPFPTWRGRRAVVLRVPELKITLSMKQRKKLWRRWGGTPEEFDQIVRSLVSAA